jgi:hypothetical protein
MENTNHIYIFKTTITTLTANCALHQTLQNQSEITQWNVDLEDIDNVLRVVSPTLSPQSIIHIVNQHGFDCCELE